jgi:hypothetical protein
VPHGWLGVHADGPLTEPGNGLDGEWRRMAAAGAESVRMSFDWRDAQPAAGTPPDLSRIDALVVAAARRRLRVLPVVHRTPAWAAERPADGAASAPRSTATYTAFLTALVGRYGPRGSLWAERRDVPRMPIREWQIWNEPNLELYWTKQPFARPYVELLRASRRALRRADPGARVVLGGLTGYAWFALRAVYRAGGRGTFDAVGLHPYTLQPRNVLRYVKLARQEMHRYGDGRLPVWITELSWPASVGRIDRPADIRTDDAGQARRLAAGLRLLAAARKRFRIERVIWYTWLSREGKDSVFDYSGLRRLRDGRIVTAPSLAVYRAAARRLTR